MPTKDPERARALYRAWYARNREKKIAQRKAYGKKYPERIRATASRQYYKHRELWMERRKQNYQKNKEKVASDGLLKRYGITLEGYERLLTLQNGVCAICLGPSGKRRFSVDHCHKTGAIRGLLCTWCNRMLGLARDNTRILVAGIRYLNKNVCHGTIKRRAA